MRQPLLPGATIGMLGSGQLGRMSGQAARELGYRLVVLSPEQESPAGQIADESVIADLDDPEGYRRIAAMCDVLTYEFENVSSDPLEGALALCPILPHPGILHIAQHRLREKETIRSFRVPTADYVVVRSLSDLEADLARFGKGVLKSVTGGYDGKGQAVVNAGDALTEVYQELSNAGQSELILEAYVPFQRELSIMVARSAQGEVVTYPCVENLHREGILHLTIAPANMSPTRTAEAHGIAAAIAEGLNLVGVMGIELFETGDGLLVNELAPRPHNSGHYTMDACVTSQFEQHIRAVAGLPLGSSCLHTPAVMLNLLGQHMKPLQTHLASILSDPMLKLHLYGKAQARPGRKMGHLTALGQSVDEALRRLDRVWPLLREGDQPLM